MRVLAMIFVLFNFVFGVGFATGSKGGTYYPIAKDIVNVCNLNMDVYETTGSLENYKKLLADPKIKFAIMQYDVLQYFKKIGNRNVNKIKMVIPFYDEEIHIIVRQNDDITRLRDLEGRVVAIGKRGSGTWLTSKLIQNTSGVKFKEKEIGTKKGLRELLNNRIDAVVMVAGAPTKLLASLPKGASKYFRLLNLSDPALNKIYQETTIPANTYKWQEDRVNTYAIKSILATFDYKPYQPSYHRVQKLYRCIKEKLPYLRRNGHPKWKEINIDSFSDVQWPVHRAVLDYNEDGMDSTPSSNDPLKNEINNILNGY